MNHNSLYNNVLTRLSCVATCLVTLVPLSAQAFSMRDVEFHNEARDTVRINEILTEAVAANPTSTSECAAFIGQKFLGTPYVAHTLEGEEEKLRVNLDELDCTTFVETVAALALTATENRTSWRDFLHSLESLRYRNGEMDGYPSRLHYICDWVVNNTYRGNLRDVTPLFDTPRYAVKTIDFMSAHRDKYPALADSANYARIRSIESGYYSHRFPYLNASQVRNKNFAYLFHSGDIVALTSTLKDLDVTHMGMIIVQEGVPHLLHASSSLGRVTLSEEPLHEFLRRNRQFTGVRILRLRDL